MEPWTGSSTSQQPGSLQKFNLRRDLWTRGALHGDSRSGEVQWWNQDHLKWGYYNQWKEIIIVKVFHRILDITELDFYPALFVFAII